MNYQEKIESVLKSIEILNEEKAFIISQLEKGRTMFLKWSFVTEIEKEISYLADTLMIIERRAA